LCHLWTPSQVHQVQEDLAMSMQLFSCAWWGRLYTGQEAYIHTSVSIDHARRWCDKELFLEFSCLSLLIVVRLEDPYWRQVNCSNLSRMWSGVSSVVPNCMNVSTNSGFLYNNFRAVPLIYLCKQRGLLNTLTPDIAWRVGLAMHISPPASAIMPFTSSSLRLSQLAMSKNTFCGFSDKNAAEERRRQCLVIVLWLWHNLESALKHEGCAARSWCPPPSDWNAVPLLLTPLLTVNASQLHALSSTHYISLPWSLAANLSCSHSSWRKLKKLLLFSSLGKNAFQSLGDLGYWAFD
jgi:hypothetical protein